MRQRVRKIGRAYNRALAAPNAIPKFNRPGGAGTRMVRFDLYMQRQAFMGAEAPPCLQLPIRTDGLTPRLAPKAA